MKTVFDDLDKYAQSNAIIDQNGNHFSYSELLHLSEEISQSLDSQSIIILISDYSLESIACYIGCIRSNIVPILLGNDIDEENLKFYIDTFRVNYIFRHKNYAFKNKTGKEGLIFGNYRIDGTWHERVSLDSDLALLMTTSGSTGSPKLVRISHENLISNTKSIAEYQDITKADKPITTLPMNYTFGLSIINTHLFSGSAIVLNNHSVLEKPFWTSFEENKPTTISGVPYTLNMLSRLKFFSRDLSFLRKITQAGGKLSKDLVLFFAKSCEDKGIDFFVMYGQAEATARMSYMKNKECIEKPDSAGKAIPGGRFWVENDEGVLINDAYQVGNLFYQGKNVYLGYAESHNDLSKENVNNYILNTGDLAFIDDEGFVFLEGRKSRFLKLFGNRVSLDDIEDYFLEQTPNNSVVASGSDDNLKIYIEGKIEIDALKHLEKKLSRFLSINHSAINIESIDKIPRNSSGKVQYKML